MEQLSLIRFFCLILLKMSTVSSDFFPITATQSGDYNDATNAAMNAVDRNPSTCNLAAESNATLRDTTFGWLQVDLGNPFLVISVNLTNSPNDFNSKYLQDFVILVSTSNNTNVQQSNICSTFNNGSSVAAEATITFTCTNALIGRYITIKRQGDFRQDAISICEVTITHNPTDGFIYLYNLPTNQIGAYNGQSSERAVDLDVQSCAQPVDPRGAKGWWSIDLQREYSIATVIIFNGNENSGSPQYAKEFEVWVGSDTDVNSRTLCYNFTGAIPLGGNVTLDCNQPSVGKLVNITRWGSANTGTVFLCEIYIKEQLSGGSSISTSITTSTSISTSSSTASSTVSTTSTSTTTSTTSVPTISASTVSRTTGPFSSTATSSRSPTVVITPRLTTNSSVGEMAVANNTTDDEENKKRKIAIICPIVIIGGLIILIASGVFLFFYLRKRRRGKSPIRYDNEEEKIDPVGGVSDTHRGNKPKPPVKPKKPSPLQRPIKASDLIAYVERMKTGDALKDEFKKLPEEDLEQVKAGKRSGNSPKNRFKNILPYDHTIVSLATKESDDRDKNYINANYITGYKNVEKMYIATQGPKVETVDDFWRMIWQENADLVVMTTLLNELGKKKCEQYWPSKVNEKKSFGSISVQLTREDVFANHVYREMEMQEGREEKRLVRQMHYLMWEDKQRPKDYLPVLVFRKKVRELQKISSQPIVIHCSAGVGRTGTYIALDTLLEQLQHEGQIGFFKCVEDLRRQRMNMVQTWKQFAFLHEAVADHFQSGDTSIACDAFAAKYKDLLRKTPNGSKLQQQFELLQRLRDQTTDKESAGNESENIHRNRNKDIVAYDESRLYLDVNYDESDYINAIYVEGLRSKEAFVLTQMPLKETIVDYWRLLWDHKLKVVVLLDDIQSNAKKLCPKFWPDESETEKYGPFTVTAISVTHKFPSILLREFSLKNTSQVKTGALTVRQYQVENWSNHSPIPNSPSLLLPMINELITNCSSESNKSIVFQCSDGAGRAGLMAAAMYVAEMIKEESNVDIFFACRIVALNRPQIISSMEQYSFLYELASAFIEYNGSYHSDELPYANVETLTYSIANGNEYSNNRNSLI